MSEQRDERGRFLPGNRASPGRTKRAIEVDFHNILVESVTPEYWLGICKRAITDALKGDRYARQFIAEYLIGKPVQAIDLRGEGNGLVAAEWLIIRTAMLEALLPYPEARQRVAEALLKAEYDGTGE